MKSTLDFTTLPFAPAKLPADTAVKRLDGIGHVLSGLDIARIQTQEDVLRALLTLDTANKCVRVILAEFRTEPIPEQLKRKSADLIGLIELARSEVVAAAEP